MLIVAFACFLTLVAVWLLAPTIRHADEATGD